MSPAEQFEAEYRTARYREYAHVSRNVSVAGALLVLALWARDLIQDPLRAQETIWIRALIAAAALLYAWALAKGLRRPVVLACGYFSVFLTEFALLHLWGRLGAPWSGSFPGYLFIYLLLPLTTLPFSFRETFAAIVLVPVVPNAQVLLGMAPGFPLLAFNAMIWPACAIAIFASSEYDRLLRRLFASHGKLQELATRDELTSLGNRRYLMERGAELVKLAQRHKRPLSVLMLDLDHFKAVNDRHGHAAGDDVLRFLGAEVRLQLRATDVAGRTGGEEFAMVLPETGLEDGVAAAERVRLAVARTPVPTDETPQPVAVTVSIGVAALEPDGGSLDELLARADEALYEAKRSGRNRVCAVAPRSGVSLQRA